jgi:predicted aldo/keto reductase-like oxidoreductase
MLYRKIEKNGDELSVLGYGCMRLPQTNKGDPGFSFGKIDEERARNQIYGAIDKGVNYFDTAMLYHNGTSETFLGKILSNSYRDKIHLATKLLHIYVNTREDMDRLLDSQLAKLQTDYLDYYLIHALNRVNWEKLKSLGVLDFLEAAKKDQRIRNTGFSYHGDPETFKEIIDAYDWPVCQIQYNYLDELNQAGKQGLKYAAKNNVGVIVMEPLRGGKLGGEIPAAVQTIWDEASYNRSPAEWALRWVWNHPEVSVVLSGMNEEDHIEENIRVAGEALPQSLSQDELELIKRVKKEYNALTKIGCTGCNYCMPCPNGVNIPSCFDFYNSAYLFDNKLRYNMLYFTFLAKSEMASMCEDCGECEEKCPQGLPIRQHLEQVVKAFEGRGAKTIAWLFTKSLNFQKWRELRARKKEHAG